MSLNTHMTKHVLNVARKLIKIFRFVVNTLFFIHSTEISNCSLKFLTKLIFVLFNFRQPTVKLFSRDVIQNKEKVFLIERKLFFILLIYITENIS
jgi:hypothetical protein